jgi:predicted CoA-substrate-specific enzyme activase
MSSLGIDIGSSSVKLCLLDKTGKLVKSIYQPHKGRAWPTFKDCLQELLPLLDPEKTIFGAVTGSGAALLKRAGDLPTINNVESLVEGALYLDQEVGSIIEIGGQSAKFITDFSSTDQSRIKISINSSCSAGTGSFLEEQLSRLGLELDDYATHALKAKSIPRIAGRCSVFAKTDITHHQQQGVSVEDILMGLAHAVVKNFRGAVMKKLPRKKPILFAGGVAQNQAIVAALLEILRLQEDKLLVSPHSHYLGALGAASLAGRQETALDIDDLLQSLDQVKDLALLSEKAENLTCLASFGKVENKNRHRVYEPSGGEGFGKVFLGIDVGSTSTNLVLTDSEDRVLSYKYLRTLGRPASQVAKGLKELEKEHGADIEIAGVGVTGSGRYMIAEMVGADVIKDEITAQAKAAMTIDPEIDTIFEIGGQDSKFISLTDEVVTDFQMNKVCAAGTGSFIEEQAKKFNIPVEDLGEIALFGNNPTNLGERCTVFMETNIAAHLAQGAKLEDISAGLCYSIVKNYLNRVVGNKKIGRKISFQGGVAYNQGVVNAFKSLTGKEIFIPRFFSVTGAMGAAILAREAMGKAKSRFKGFRAERTNTATDQIQDWDSKAKQVDRFNERVNDLIFQGYDGTTDKTQKTVGIPRALFTFGMYPMFSTFFKKLGFNVIMSEASNEKTIAQSQEYSLDETCYPVKLVNGHVAELVKKKVDYIFFPDLYTVEHPGSHTRQDFGCAYMQLAFKLVNQAMELDKHGIELLSPTFAFNLGPQFMMQSLGKLGEKLGKTQQETQKALQAGMQAFHAFENRMQEQGKKALAEVGPEEKAFVLISKVYGVADPVLNMGIPGKLMEMGYKVLNFFDLPETDIASGHPNMYWPFGQHILESARLVAEHPNLYPIFLTHHCCGPDAVFIHYFREIMQGKPYLNIEVDEHSSDVGVITRVEAFVSSLEKIKPVPAAEIGTYVEQAVCPQANLKSKLSELEGETTLFLPYLPPYSQIFAALFEQNHIKAQVLDPTSQNAIEAGRKHTMTSEYFSFAALLGDVLLQAGKNGDAPKKPAFLIPQCEGAEADGQYSRLVRTMLNEQGKNHLDILSPYMEDALFLPESQVNQIILGLIAGDLINLAATEIQNRLAEFTFSEINKGSFGPESLLKLARDIRLILNNLPGHKTILALGDPALLFNDRLNDFRLLEIQRSGQRLIKCPMSEYMWFFWQDFCDQNGSKVTDVYRQNLENLKGSMQMVAQELGEFSPFSDELEELRKAADQTVGYYAGINGRYRHAKHRHCLKGVQGVICLASTYENTNVALGVLERAMPGLKPTLELTFDGNQDDNTLAKIESFVHYL